VQPLTARGGSGLPAPLIRSLDTYICRYPLNRRLRGPHSRPGRFTKQHNVFPFSAIEPRPVRSLVTTTVTPSIFRSRPYKF